MIKLREAQFPDYRLIAKLHSTSWQKSYRGILSDAFLDHEVEQERNDAWFKRLQFPTTNQQVTIATNNENMVGFSCILLDDDPDFGSLLDNLHVSITMQKSGIGKLLMKDCARTVYEKGSSNKMYLWVYESNTNARTFYERLEGKKFETIKTQNPDGTRSPVCRYIWNDVSKLL